MTLVDRVGQALNVRQGEWKLVLIFFGLTLLIGLGNTFGRSVSQTLFIAEVGAANLKYLWLIQELGVSILAFVYAYLTQKLSAATITVIFIALSLTLLTSLWFVLNIFGVEQLFIYYVLYVSFYIPFILLSIHLASYIQLHISPLQRKRLMSIILAGLTAGSALGGSAYTALVLLFGPKMTLIATTLMYSGSLVLVVIARRRVKMLASMSDKTRKKSNPFTNFGDNIKLLVNYRLIFFIALSSFTFFIIAKLVEFQIMSLFTSFSMQTAGVLTPDSWGGCASAATFGGIPEDSVRTSIGPYVDPVQRSLGALFGVYEVAANFLALAVQIFITPRIISRLGVGLGNQVYPSMHMASASFMTILGLAAVVGSLALAGVLPLAAAIFARFVNAESRKTIMRPAGNLLFNGIPTNLWGRANAMISGVVNPISVFAATGLFILAEQFISSEVPCQPGLVNPNFFVLIAGISLGLAVAYYLISFPQRRAYNKAVLSLLETRNFDRDAGALDFGKLDTRTFEMVKATIESEELERAKLGIELVTLTKDDRFFPMLVERYPEMDQEAQLAIVESIIAYDKQEGFEQLARWLNDTPRPEVQRELILALGEDPFVNRLDQIRPYVDDNEPKRRYAARMVMHRKGEKKIEDAIIDALRMGDEDEKIEACRAVEQLALRDMKSHLYAVLMMSDGALLQAALRAIQGVVTREDEDLGELLLDILINTEELESQLVILDALRTFAPISRPNLLPHFYRYMQSRTPKHRRVVKELFRDVSPRIADLMYAELFVSNSTAEQKLTLLEILHGESVLTRDDLRQVGLFNLALLIRTRLWLNDLTFWRSDHPNSRALPFLQHIIEEKHQGYLAQVVRCTCYLVDAEVLTSENITRGLVSTDKNSQSMAAEALTNLGERVLGNALAGMFDINYLDNTQLTSFAQSHLKHDFQRLARQEMLEAWTLLNDDYLTSTMLYYLIEIGDKDTFLKLADTLPPTDAESIIEETVIHGITHDRENHLS